MGIPAALGSMIQSLSTYQLAWGMIAMAGLAAALLLGGIVAPYGRYSSSAWGPLIPPRLAWLTQEILSLAIPVVWLAAFATQEQRARVSDPVNAALMAMFLVHYIHRDLIYPFRIVPGKGTPLAVWSMAAGFCAYNGYLQTRYLLEEAAMGRAIGPTFLLGAALWALGWGINLHSDTVLIRQRGGRRKGYSIPQGGLFALVSAANYFGEVVEWLGWALACRSLPATAFALFTTANLVPRALHHHAWYHKTFKTYPKQRRAIIPFLL
ncbi:hypothetical protein ACKKBG_A13335 [Auxenochlorella protothecoides x Auxenochlorella symbiontica]